MSYPWFKAAVIALLVYNTAVFFAAGTATEALDAAAWLVLLASFELETGWGNRFRESAGPTLLRGARLGAAIAILAAAIGYIRGGEWLDAYDALLWLVAFATIEIDVFKVTRRVTAGSRSG